LEATQDVARKLKGEIEALMKGTADQRASNLRTIKENKSLLLELK
jgi:hypothetical protein